MATIGDDPPVGVDFYEWSFGDGATSSAAEPSHVYQRQGTYTVTLELGLMALGRFSCTKIVTTVVTFVGADRCCANSFALEPEEHYVLGAWAREEVPIEDPPQTAGYSSPSVSLFFKVGDDFVPAAANPLVPEGAIIDGWQRIEEEFQVPTGATELRIDLENGGGNEVFFDDIRVFPTNGSMKTFVYDPLTLRLMAELDESNYATFYEYDEEGALIRVKKETERGIMTIQESRNATHKGDR